MRKMVKLFLCIVACICLNGCVTRYRTNGEVLEYQRQIDLLEERIRARDRALTQVLEQLKTSQIEAEGWKAQSTTLSKKLMSINEQLNNCLMTIEKLEAEIRLKNKVIGWLLTILVVRTLLMVIGYVLYAKGVRLPRWLDILL